MSGPQFEHRPVLTSILLHYLEPQPGQIILDATVGLGGHAALLAPRIMPGGRYIGLDVDKTMLAGAVQRLRPVEANIVLEQSNYADFGDVLARLGIEKVDDILADLGVNSGQLADERRGFSFDRDGPLDMRFNPEQKTTAADLVNALGERELADLFYDYGQEMLSRKIARRICEVRRDSRILTTRALANAVGSAYTSAGAESGRIHPATRVFQALRIAVNRELDNLSAFLQKSTNYLRPGGKLAVISFHSLEDGMVKRHMREAKSAGRMRLLTKTPVGPDADERRDNARSRSAKLRVAQRVEDS